MHDWLYTIRERFTPELSESWRDYLAFSGFQNIVEVVTLDTILCPDVVTELREADWDHNVLADSLIDFFRDLDYLLNRQPLDPSLHQILAVVQQPNGSELLPPGFMPCGFDIMDAEMGDSTLTNCGPIPEAFDSQMVNEYGLLADRDTAYKVRDTLRRLQPDDPHLGACEVWQVARMFPAVAHSSE